MKLTTIFGFIFGLTIIGLTIFYQQGTEYFLSWSALGITFGGTISAVIIYFSPWALKSSISAFFKIFTEKYYSKKKMIDIMVAVCREARIAGFSNLQNLHSVQKIKFLKKGLRFLADGMEPEQLSAILTREKQMIFGKNRVAERVFKIAGSFAPMFGMMGTVIGLISMLHKVNDPSSIPAAMGLALVTTFYGLILSALIFKPISGKIRDKNQLDNQVKDMIIDAILAIQRGENSQIIKENLQSYL
ncbi:MAG: hypothetical protein HN952_02870 [Candidatus Cloacimonetes bacterium]|jgi:chemotaxis protein MotA|nr:hypothetical protein [Candidatus Cloacimonadota bacterium]MBT6993877.1 hypothetical protein [Candidatus Cloacimonadota bacterium]MBT7469168.1 hypothetical protein [Candidatus Cloacimonadota bacterium]